MPVSELRYSNKTKFYLLLGAALVLLLGYVDLARGGITLSAILLAIAYCAAIPAALWNWRAANEHPAIEKHPPSYGIAAIVSACVFVLYAVTLAPSTAMWDTSEYIAAAYTFGLPHPPGNPLFVILGRVFSILPIASTVAIRINILAALCSAVSAGMWFLITERVLVSWFPERWQRITGGVLAALIGATAFTVWNQSVVNEKVYTVSLVGIALISWLMIRWADDPDGPKADRLLVLVAYLCGLGYANHMAGMLAAPAVGLAVLIIRPRTIIRWKLLLACVAVLFLGLTPFATQPIRAAYFPAINEGEPTACRTQLAVSCTFSQGTLDAFEYNFNRGQYGKPDLSDRQASFGQQVGMWWLYFKWQWIRDAHQEHAFAQALFAAIFLVLGLLGGWVHWQRDRRSFWYFGPLMFTMTLLLIYYLNFKLGASQDAGNPAPHEVRDRDYFFLWSFSAWGVWAALGLIYVWESVAALIATESRKEGKTTIVAPTSRAFRLAAPVLALAFVPLVANATSAPRSRHRATSNIAADLLNSVEPYGVLVTVGDNDTFPLWYAQEVEGIRRDVVVANTSLLNTDWYGRQIIRRPIYDYDAAKGPAIYRDKQWVKPTTPPLHLTFAQVDAVPAYYEITKPMLFNAREIKATVDPRRLEYGVLQRADLLVLQMIHDSWPERPIYFARSAGGYPRALGLENYTLVQGLAAKVFVPPATVAQMKDTVFVQGDGWLDVARTKTLWNDVFKGHQAVIREGQWIDQPSASMPLLYVFGGVELSDALRATGDDRTAASVLSTTRQVAHIAGYDSLFKQLDAAYTNPTAGDSSGVQLHLNPSEAPKTQSTEPTKAPVKKP